MESIPCQATFEFDVRKYRLWFEDNPVVINANRRCVDLFNKVGDVVGQTKKVLLVGGRSGLASYGQLSCWVVIAQRAQAFKRHHIVSSDAVVEHYAPCDFKLICRD